MRIVKRGHASGFHVEEGDLGEFQSWCEWELAKTEHHGHGWIIGLLILSLASTERGRVSTPSRFPVWLPTSQYNSTTFRLPEPTLNPIRKMKLDREALGEIAYEACRTSINGTTDYPIPKWEWADHETQLAFREAGVAVAEEILRMVKQ
jgi:hypothetical protein